MARGAARRVIKHGLFAAIVGPSGAGKDSLIRALAERLADDRGFAVVKRVVTREADAHEDHHTLDRETFDTQAGLGRFALTWRAHGLSYGVPAEVDEALASGMTLVCNLSRAAVEDARRRWPEVWVALVTATPETLAARLALRAREGHAERRARLERSADAAPDAIIENDGELAQAADRLYALLQTRRGIYA
jgi:ribose 1,5-bisphosphokinase